MIERKPRRRSGFTLMELMIVVAIVVIVSAAAIPAIRPALSQRKVSSAALLVQAELSRCRDAAIRSNAPRGIRLMVSLDDRFKFVPPPATGGNSAYLNSTPAYTRMLSIEPAPDYSEGVVCAKPVGYVDNPSSPETDSLGNPLMGYLRVQECAYFYPIPGVALPNTRTNWYWNIRVGDKFRFHDSGNIYTVVGPVGVKDATRNPELFVNNDTTSPGDYGTGIQFLYLVNGLDDDKNGYVDDSFDNVDNNGDTIIDPAPGLSVWSDIPTKIIDESELETFPGMTVTQSPLTLSNSLDEDGDGTPDNLSEPDSQFCQLSYTIQRRPIPSPGGRVLDLPSTTAIDMTGWMRNGPSGGERSRLPVDPNTGFIDILIAPNGQVLRADYNTTQPGPPPNFPYFHFWITDTDDIYEPLSSPSNSITTALPTPDVPDSGGRMLKGERRLVSINTKTGQIVTGSAENFNPANINTPFFNVEHGLRDEQ